VTIKSSGQTKAAACDFSSLSLSNTIQGSRTYKVGSNFDGIHISTEIDGKDALTPAYCKDELYWVLSLKVGERYEQVWSQDSWITGMDWSTNFY
jgi:hypothetical protein